MKYYAGAIRKAGIKACNADGIMIKAMRCGKNEMVIMAYCSAEKNYKMLNGKLNIWDIKRYEHYASESNRVIRMLEEACIEELCDGDGFMDFAEKIKELCEEEFSVGRKRNNLTLTVFITFGRHFFIIGNGYIEFIKVMKDKVFREQVCNNSEGGSYDARANKLRSFGRCNKFEVHSEMLDEAQTFLFSSRSFTDKLSNDEILKSLCPQMQNYEGDMFGALENLAENLSVREEDRPYSASALCIR